MHLLPLLFCFNQFGDLERCLLRPGNVHSAEDWRLVLEPVVARYRDPPLRRYFRADAAFAKPEIYEFLEAEGYAYVIGLPTNAVHLELTDPPRRATAELCAGLSCQPQLPGGNLEQASPGRGQGRVASW